MGSLFKKLFFLILVSLSFDAKSFDVKADLFEAFTKGWHEDYQPLTCSDNIIKLSKRHPVFQSSDVVHVFHKNIPYLPIKALKARRSSQQQSSSKKSWIFHAFLLVDKTSVFDLDYLNNPQIMRIDHYLKTMWDQTELVNNYRFQVKKISEYHLYDRDGFMNEHEVFNYDEFINYLTAR